MPIRIVPDANGFRLSRGQARMHMGRRSIPLPDLRHLSIRIKIPERRAVFTINQQTICAVVGVQAAALFLQLLS